jgi:hypothetical protein
MLDDTVPKELERICLKALAKLTTERYNTALDLAEDLRHFLASGPATEVSPVLQFPYVEEKHPAGVARIIPKGMRSFDEHDADFFLELLPGPRDRDGLPESIRFWKTRIEETDPDATFSVGLIYGPSGCGKSSLAKAGLLPRLATHVTVVYMEATQDSTETQLSRSLRKKVPQLPAEANLPESFQWLRENVDSRDGKLLIVLDQFEQWLHAQMANESNQLVDALRQCDGGRLQCLIMVRDDFYTAVNTFFRELEVSLVEGRNYALVTRFDRQHAAKVLIAFGRAYGKLPAQPLTLSDQQARFVEQAITQLAENGKVASVRLALFADMMQGRSWMPVSLKEVGGVRGIGVAFL